MISLLALTSCFFGGSHSPQPEPLMLVVNEPVDGAFVSGEEVLVAGQVSAAGAYVFVNGVEVKVGEEGQFSVLLPSKEAVLVVDVQAQMAEQTTYSRSSVFMGVDPYTSWPGQLQLQLTRRGFAGAARSLSARISKNLLTSALVEQLPVVNLPVASFSPTKVELTDVQVDLTPATKGVVLEVHLQSVEVGYSSYSRLFHDQPLSVAFERLTLGVTLEPRVSDEEVRLSLRDIDIDLSGPRFAVGPYNTDVVGPLLNSVSGLLSSAAETVLNLVFSGEVGHLSTFRFDLRELGVKADVSLGDVVVDEAGLTSVIEVELEDHPANAPLSTRLLHSPEADAVVTVHEAMIQQLVDSSVVNHLTVKRELTGAAMELLSAPVRALPGVSSLPNNIEALCVELSPGDQRLVRLSPALDRLGNVLLPQMSLSIGYRQGQAPCHPWMAAELQGEVELVMSEATEIDVSLAIANATILLSGQQGWAEASVVQGISEVLESTFDADEAWKLDLLDYVLIEAPTTGSQPQIVHVQQALNASGDEIPGAISLGLVLWPEQ